MLRQVCEELLDHIDLEKFKISDFNIASSLDSENPEVNFDALLFAVFNVLINDPTGVALEDFYKFGKLSSSKETKEVVQKYLSQITEFLKLVT